MTNAIIKANVNDLWEHALREVLHRGERVAPRNNECLEIRGVTLGLTHPRQNILTTPLRKLNYRFMLAEALWILFGHNDVATIAGYNSKMRQFSDDGETLWGAYGPRIYEQLGQVLDLLRRDPQTRQAVMTTWRPEALVTTTKDVPCTLSLQFFIRQGAVELHVTMRSNDLWLGFP